MPLKSLSEREWDVYGRGRFGGTLAERRLNCHLKKNLVVSDAVDNT